jgi:plasmid maintenance system killer protein
MIESFGNALAEDLFYDRKSKSTRSFPNELRRIARRKLLYLHDAADLQDLRVPPGNRLEGIGRIKALSGVDILADSAGDLTGPADLSKLSSIC